MTRPNTPEDFWKKVDRRGPYECWPWKAATDARNGYGHFIIRQVFWLAHRFAYYLTHGPIPEGSCVCHSCDNPPCCNPAHLFLGTQLENIQDRVKKGRCGTTGGPRRLTAPWVRCIRALAAAGLTAKEIAGEVPNATKSNVHNVIKGVTWRDLF